MTKELKNIFTFYFIIQSLSLVNMLSSGHLNGDFFIYDINKFWLIFTYIVSFFPYLLLLGFLSLRNKQFNYVSIAEFKYFDNLVIGLLLINIFLIYVLKTI